MKSFIFKAFAAATLLLGMATQAHAAAATPYKLGDVIPAATQLTDQNGKAHTLGNYRGKVVVLEWTNYGCPFVHKHYDSGNMQKLQETYTGKGVIWLSVISSAPGKQGYLTVNDAPAAIAKMGFKGTAVMLDPTGALGQSFAAETSPHMFVLNAQGKLVYMGAIDSIPSFNKEDIAKADNYVSDALDEVLAGKEVSTPQTNPYGCSIKY